MASPDSEFLTRVSEAAFELGADGFRVSAMTITSRQIAFTDTGITPDPPLYAEGEPPPMPGREGRGQYDWQPATDAPAWMNMAWLLEDLATWIQPLAEEHVTLIGVEAPLPHWCDILVRDGDTAYRVRIPLADRKEPLDFPGMYLRDMFAEGRHRDPLTPEQTGRGTLPSPKPTVYAFFITSTSASHIRASTEAPSPLLFSITADPATEVDAVSAR